jgi:uncharacterized protein
MRASRRTALTAMTGAALVVVLLGGCTSTASTPAGPKPGTATASGSGVISAAPDQALMTFGVEARGKNAKIALNAVSGKAAKINAALKRTGVAEKDLQTANVSIYPEYRESKSGGKPQIVGYQASLSVNAKVRDLAALSDVIQAGTVAGATDVNGPSFSIADDSPIQAQAIQKAVDDARRMAQAMAKASGKKLGSVISVTSVAAANPYLPALDSINAPAAAMKGVPIQTGQLDVTSNVTVTFELK